MFKKKKEKKKRDSDKGGIRTHAPFETGTLLQRLGPLGHLAVRTLLFGVTSVLSIRHLCRMLCLGSLKHVAGGMRYHNDTMWPVEIRLMLVRFATLT